MRCDGCKFWDTEEGKKASNIEVRQCKHAEMWWDSTEWVEDAEWPAPDRALKPECAGARMFVQDGSDYYAALYTTADFFCADHSSK